jgi:nitroreductase
MEIIASTRNVPLTSLQGFADYMKGNIAKMSEDQKVVWAAKQTYIALGNLLNAAAELKIDTTPMEGFNPEMVNEILGLTNLNLNAALIATLGYRHEADATQYLKKVRKSTDDLFITI